MSKRLAALLAMLISAMGLIASAPATAQGLADPLPEPPPIVKPTAHLHGIIKDAKAGNPIAGACVDVHYAQAWNVVATVCAGDDGAYSLRVPATTLRIRARATGYRPLWWPNALTYEYSAITFKDGEDRQGDFALGGDVGTLSGMVKRQDDQPEFFPRISVVPVDATTSIGIIVGNLDGTFSHDGIPAGRYYLSFNIAGYPTQWYPAVPTKDQATVVTIDPSQPLAISERAIALATSPAPRGLATVTGKVTDGTGAPVPNASVTITRTTGQIATVTTSDADGKYTTPKVLSSEGASISFAAPGLATTWGAGFVVPTQQSLPAGVTVLNPVLAVQFGTVRGKVADFDGTLPPFSTQLTLHKASPTGLGIVAGKFYARLDGTYEIPNVPAGTYKLLIYTPTRGSQWHDSPNGEPESPLLTVVTGQTLELTDTLFPPGYVDVTVRDAMTGLPIGSMCVDTNIRAYRIGCTNADGIARLGPFWFSTPVATMTSVYGSPVNYFREYARFTAQPGAVTPVELKLLPGAVIEMSVSGPDGQVVHGVCATGERPEIGRPRHFEQCVSVIGNKAMFGPFEPGRVRLLLTPQNNDFGAQWLTGNGGSGQMEDAILLELKVGATTVAPKALLDRPYDLTGLITYGDVTPITEACATVVPKFARVTGCSVNGQPYRIPALGPYKWPVRFSANGYATEWSGDVASRSQAALIELPRASGLNAALAVGGTVAVEWGCCGDTQIITAYDAYTGDELDDVYGSPLRLEGLNSGRIIIRQFTANEYETKVCWFQVSRRLFRFGSPYFSATAGKETVLSGLKCSATEPMLLRPTTGRIVTPTEQRYAVTPQTFPASPVRATSSGATPSDGSIGAAAATVVSQAITATVQTGL